MREHGGRIGSDDAGLPAAPRAADRAGRSPRPRRCRAGCWSAAVRGRDDRRARCRPSPPCRRCARTAARPRSRRDRNTHRAWPSRARGYRRRTSISMPSITAMEILALEAERLDRRRKAARARHRRCPRRSRRCRSATAGAVRPACRAARRVRDVVDLAAERIDLVHRLALRLRHDAHRGVERAAGGALGGGILGSATATRYSLDSRLVPRILRPAHRPRPADPAQ